MDLDEISSKLDKLKDKDELNIILIQTKKGKLETTDLSTLSDCLNTHFKDQTEWEKFVSLRKLIDKLWAEKGNINIKFFCYYVSEPVDKNLFKNSTFSVRVEALKRQ